MLSPVLKYRHMSPPPATSALDAPAHRTAAVDVAVPVPSNVSPAVQAISSVNASELWFVEGRAYDLKKFVEAHPGGREALMLARGTNCTELFHAYHLMRGPSKARLAKYEVDVDRTDPQMIELLGGSSFTFDDDGFYKTIALRVRKHLKATGKQAGATWGWQLLAVICILLSIALTVPAYAMGSIWAAIALGFIRAITSVGPGHSMSHLSLFPRGNWNSLVFRLGTPFLVSTWAIWTNSHVRSHHVDTLTASDLQDNYPLKRVQPAMPHRSWHKAQHLYIWLVYFLGLTLWAMQDLVASVTSLFSDKGMSRVFRYRRRVENTIVIAFNLAFTVGMPFIFLDWPHALLVCLIANGLSSLLVVVQIVVNHEVPETMNRIVEGEPLDWGVHQVLTSHNYGVDSPLALHLSGGLNMQVEHHLFPRLHYIHYPAISHIVQEACVEFGLPYHSSKNIWQAMSKHYQLLKTNSVAPPTPSSDGEDGEAEVAAAAE